MNVGLVPGALGAGKTVVVTGAASGIGRQVIVELQRSGTTAIAVDVAPCPNDYDPGLYREVDVTDVDAARSIVAELARERGRIDGLVTCAGVEHVARVEDFNVSDISRTFSVNFIGTANWVSAVAAAMRHSHGGRIVTVASQLAERPVAGVGYYAASKAAVITLTQVAAIELAAAGIAVNCICPGPTDTPMTQSFLERMGSEAFSELKAQILFGRIATPSELARPILFLLSDEASFITGVSLNVDGGFVVA